MFSVVCVCLSVHSEGGVPCHHYPWCIRPQHTGPLSCTGPLSPASGASGGQDLLKHIHVRTSGLRSRVPLPLQWKLGQIEGLWIWVGSEYPPLPPKWKLGQIEGLWIWVGPEYPPSKMRTWPDWGTSDLSWSRVPPSEMKTWQDWGTCWELECGD